MMRRITPHAAKSPARLKISLKFTCAANATDIAPCTPLTYSLQRSIQSSEFLRMPGEYSAVLHHDIR
jgi:hypothetical protein